MKKITRLSNAALPLLGASSLLFVSCGTVQKTMTSMKNTAGNVKNSVGNTYKNALSKVKQPLTNNGANALDGPGGRSSFANSNTGSTAASKSYVNTNNHGFNNGDIVEVVIPDAALFAKVPKSGDRFKKVLKVGDTLRVVGGERDFIKVVTERGETGYVSSVMVVTKGSLTQSTPKSKSTWKPNNTSAPIVPDIAPEPEVRGIGTPDSVPSVAPAEVPNIIAPIPVPSVPDPGLSIPGVPAIDLPVPDLIPTPTPEILQIPDLSPVIPSIPDFPAPAPVPSNTGLPQ